MGIETVLAYEEIKGVLHVKEKERDTFVQTTEDQIKKNKEKLQYMRQVSGDLRKEVTFQRSGGKHVVSKIFVSRPKEKPLMRSKNLETSSGLMDQKAFEMARSLGKLNYELQQAQQRLVRKETVLADLNFLIDDNPAERKIKNFLAAQSKAELVKMKLMDAVNTGNFYKKIIHGLQKEICDRVAQIKKMVRIKQEKVSILNDIHGIKDGAVKEFKLVQNQMRPLHVMIENKTREFDDNLRKKRKEYTEQRRDTNTKCMGELKMDVVEDENPEVRKAKELTTNIELKSYQDIFEQVKGALDISNVEDVLHRVQEEHARYRRLCDQLDESNLLYDTLQADLDDLREELSVLSYDSAPSGMTRKEEQTLTEQAEERMQRVQEAVAKLTEKEKVIAGVKLATVAIHSKLIYIKLHPGQITTLIGDAAKDMEVIWNKAERLMARYGTGNMEEEHHDNKELQKYMEMRLPEDNLRTVLRPLDYRSRDNLRYDFDDVQAGYVSREDIKKRHQDILKPKKRKPPPGRKGGRGGSTKK